MFKIITDSIENVLDVASDTAEFMVGGDGPDRRQVAQLLADGLTIAAIAQGFGVAETLIEELTD